MVRISLLVILTLVLSVSYAQCGGDCSESKVEKAMKLMIEKASKLGVAKIEGVEKLDGVDIPVLHFGKNKINGLTSLVDDVKKEVGASATVFVRVGDNFIRITTNILKDGKRAIGTPLDPKGKAYAKIVKGKAFYGKVDILGKMYNTGYEPIFDEKKNVIGIYYVGYLAE